MRIANKTLTDRFAANVNRAMELINRYNNEIASGKKVNRPSDAPDDISLILQFKRTIANVDQYGKNVDAGLSFLRATDSALLASVEQGRKARKLAIAAANDPTLFSDSSIAGLISDISGLKEEIREQANTQLSGKYIFSGYSTKTKTYSDTSNGYRGDNFSIHAKISDDSTVPINITGDVAFRESSIAGELADITKPVGGVTEMYFTNNVPEAAGKLTATVQNPGSYTGTVTGTYRVVVNTSNTTAGDTAGLVLDLEFTDGTTDAAGNLIYSVVDTQAAVGGVANEVVTLTDNGLSFDVNLDLLGATQTVPAIMAANTNGNISTGGTIALNQSGGPFTGVAGNDYYVEVVTANAVAGDLAGMQVQLMRSGVAVGGVVNVPAGAGPNNVVLGTVDGVTFDANITVGGAVFNVAERSDGFTSGALSLLETYDVAGEVRFTVSDGTNTSADIVFSAGTIYTTAQIEAIIDNAIAAGSPAAPTIDFYYDADGNPVFEIVPRDSTGTMEFVDLSVGTNQSTKGRIRDMFGITAGYKNIFGVLDDLMLAINEKNHDFVKLQISRLDNVEGEMLKSEGIAGTVERSLEDTKSHLESIRDEQIELLAALEDADPTESITNLTNQQTLYDATLYYGSLIQRKSLLDFLR
jgi:flagellar hook-associated protein 3